METVQIHLQQGGSKTYTDVIDVKVKDGVLYLTQVKRESICYPLTSILYYRSKYQELNDQGSQI